MKQDNKDKIIFIIIKFIFALLFIYLTNYIFFKSEFQYKLEAWSFILITLLMCLCSIIIPHIIKKIKKGIPLCIISNIIISILFVIYTSANIFEYMGLPVISLLFILIALGISVVYLTINIFIDCLFIMINKGKNNDKIEAQVITNQLEDKCSRCGNVINKNNSFCTICGEKKGSEKNNNKFCSKCGNPINNNESFCNKCGNSTK